MIYFQKYQKSPGCLQIEKDKEINGIKQDGDYKCRCVLKILRDDFKNKCYICERKDIADINVEPFKPHRNKNKDLKFDWNNLFFACIHCNTTKLDKYDNILDCTNENDRVEEQVKQTYHPFPRYEVIIEAMNDDERVINTRDLLHAVFYGTSKLKTIETENLCKQLKIEIRKYQDCIEEYLDAYDSDQKTFV